jgi:uncharacterized protein YceK
MKKIYFGLLMTMFLVSACSTAKVRILPGEGVHKVVSTDYEKDDAEEAAVKEATEYCHKMNKQVAFVNSDKKSEYTGKMDENTRNTVKKASNAAIILSGPLGVGTRSGAVGGILGGAGIVGHEMTNDRDYKAEWDFKCID